MFADEWLKLRTVRTTWLLRWGIRASLGTRNASAWLLRQRTGSKIPSSPEGSLANATRHSDSANRDPKYAEDNTAIVRPADSVACCIWCMKSAPGRKSNACTTVV